MRGLFFELYYKKIFIFRPMTTFSLFLLYIVVTPLMLGFEKDFLCHFHLGLIRIPPLFSSLSVPFFRAEKEDGTFDLYSLSASCLPKILLLRLGGYWLLQISCLFLTFPLLELLYQFDQSGMDRFNIFLGSLILTLVCGMHSALSLGLRSWNSLHNLIILPTLLPSILSCTSIETEWFHVLSSIGYFSSFVFLFPISVSFSCQD